jgi:hypothetical protein
MGFDLKEVLRTLASLAFLLAAMAMTAAVVAEAGRLKTWQNDLAVLDDVRYGLLDADNWVAQISDILDRRIEGFELTPENRPVIKRNVERVLDRLLAEIDDYQRRRNQTGGTWIERIQGALRQEVQDLVLDFDELRSRVPAYAESVLEELTKPDAKAEIKDYLSTRIADLAGSTFSKTDRSDFERVLAEHGCAEADACRAGLQSDIEQSKREVGGQAVAVIGLVVLLFLATLYRHQDISERQMLLLTLGTLVLLAGGVLTPMIGIEARITELRLQLLGEPVLFQDQVLYFQSKSVTDVVRVLAETGEADMILVAFLVALFSVIFPLAKVVASFVYYRNLRGLRASRLVRFFALKSGKWSMADVLVIAMFMAFVGFRGLVSNQLSTLSRTGGAADVLTTNGTLLQVGFYLFLAFTIASMVVSTLLDQRFGEQHVT